ncbi:MAG: hypothetical protein IT318_26435 [Anaerolineales bacterium]|nr:hypothetical protein [Anaerolineales bacterium]
MRSRWLVYVLLGFGLADWYFLDLLASVSQNQALSQHIDQANALTRLVVVLAIISANYGIWLVPLMPAAIYEMKRSGSVRLAALAAVLVWSAAMVSYYAYYAFMLMWVGLPNMDFMLFANRHLPGYWADWWPPFRRVIVEQFLEWMGIAVVGGTIVGALTALAYRWIAKRPVRGRATPEIGAEG